MSQSVQRVKAYYNDAGLLVEGEPPKNVGAFKSENGQLFETAAQASEANRKYKLTMAFFDFLRKAGYRSGMDLRDVSNLIVGNETILRTIMRDKRLYPNLGKKKTPQVKEAVTA